VLAECGRGISTSPDGERNGNRRRRDAVDALLDRSVGAEEYLDRGRRPKEQSQTADRPRQIDFEALAETVRRPKRAC